MLILLSDSPLAYGGSAYSKEQLGETLKQCCFSDQNKKLLLFREPITLLLFDLGGLDDLEISSLKSTIEILKSKSGIDITFKNPDEIDEQLTSAIFLITLPNSRGDIDQKRLKLIEDKYVNFNVKSQDSRDFQSVLDEVYLPGHWFFQAGVFTSEYHLASMSFIRLPFANNYLDQLVELGLLITLGYNKNLKIITNTIFDTKNHEMTELDYDILKILYLDKSIHSLSLDGAIKRIN